MNDFQFPFEPEGSFTRTGYEARAGSNEWIHSDTVIEVQR